MAPDAWRIFATIANRAPDAFAGTELIADRGGWLRAVAAPGTRWSDANLMCGATGTTAARESRTSAGGIDALLARIDAEPVADIEGGYTH
ncbi:cytochrome C [Burkholderia sp. Ap-962]|nr:cytochrome C [Burkholderia sp. Ap-962]